MEGMSSTVYVIVSDVDLVTFLLHERKTFKFEHFYIPVYIK